MSELKKRILTSFCLFIVLFFSFLSFKFFLILLLIINFLALDEFVKIIKKIYVRKNFSKLVATFSIFLYMSVFSIIIYMFLIKSFEISKIYFLFLLMISISTDIGGFIFGRIIGGKKLTKISPNKTYSGVLGSLIFSVIVGFSFYFIQNKLTIDVTILFIFIIFISILSQLGDLFISLIKRKAKIKDTGNFLPGHGGILDRIDGMLLALPIGIIFLTI